MNIATQERTIYNMEIEIVTFVTSLPDIIYCVACEA